MITIFLFITIFLLILFIFLYWKERKRKNEIAEINNSIYLEEEKILNKIKEEQEEKEKIEQEIQDKREKLEIVEQSLQDSVNVSRKAFENFCEVLDKNYEEKVEEQQKSIELLRESYQKIQNDTLEKISNVQNDLDTISATRTAAIQAQLKEKEIQDKEQFYSLSIEEIDKKEIKILQNIENELRDPRPIRMIIWQTYYSKKANELIARILKENDICGIYKITNKKTKMCYIGQSKKIKERLRTHMKHGLGIDTPTKNKLYSAMKEDGLESFTFELLEQCNPQDLNEKENFYIKLYKSNDFGYNSINAPS